MKAAAAQWDHLRIFFTTRQCSCSMFTFILVLLVSIVFHLSNVVSSSPTVNSSDYLEMYKYERHTLPNETPTSATTTTTTTATATATATATPPITSTNMHDQNLSEDREQSRLDLYSLQLSPHQQQRQSKHEWDIVYEYHCPKQHYIHPCDCLELDKRAEMLDGSGDIPEAATNVTPTVEMIEVEPVSPETIETVAFCKNIRNVQVLTEAIRGFQGHRVNYFVLDGCKLPPFPNNLFKGIHVVWMEILNSTVQFHDNFFNIKACP